MSNASDLDDRPLTIARERFERIYGAIRDRICLLEYAPGMRLGEEELAREFGVSRTPIRRVLSRLESEGLLESRHGVGTFVTTVDIGNLLQVYHLRMELAVLIGRLDPLPRSEGDLDRIRAILTQCDKLLVAPDPRRIAQINMEFFRELAAMIGNEPLKQISERLYYQTHRIWLTSVPHLNLRNEMIAFSREVAEILSAMEVGDLEAVGHIRRSHISMSVKRMQKFAMKDLT
jgi:DNA-binding GntR family transcriptional regulator